MGLPKTKAFKVRGLGPDYNPCWHNFDDPRLKCWAHGWEGKKDKCIFGMSYLCHRRQRFLLAKRALIKWTSVAVYCSYSKLLMLLALCLPLQDDWVRSGSVLNWRRLGMLWLLQPQRRYFLHLGRFRLTGWFFWKFWLHRSPGFFLSTDSNDEFFNRAIHGVVLGLGSWRRSFSRPVHLGWHSSSPCWSIHGTESQRLKIERIAHVSRWPKKWRG